MVFLTSWVVWIIGRGEVWWLEGFCGGLLVTGRYSMTGWVKVENSSVERFRVGLTGQGPLASPLR